MMKANKKTKKYRVFQESVVPLHLNLFILPYQRQNNIQ